MRRSPEKTYTHMHTYTHSHTHSRSHSTYTDTYTTHMHVYTRISTHAQHNWTYTPITKHTLASTHSCPNKQDRTTNIQKHKKYPESRD